MSRGADGFRPFRVFAHPVRMQIADIPFLVRTDQFPLAGLHLLDGPGAFKAMRFDLLDPGFLPCPYFRMEVAYFRYALGLR